MDVPEDLDSRLAEYEENERLLCELASLRMQMRQIQRQLDALHGVDRGALLAGGWID